VIIRRSVWLWPIGSQQWLGVPMIPSVPTSALNPSVWTACLGDSFAAPGIGNKIMAQSERNACPGNYGTHSLSALQLPMHL